MVINMNKELANLIIADLSRIYPGKKSLKDFSIKEKFFMSPELKYQILWRKASYYRQNKPSGFLSKWYGIKLMKELKKTHINIPSETHIDKGLFIGHLGRIVIHPEAKLGKNINLSAGITIGQANRGKMKGVPTIQDNVWIGTGAVIVGNITIGTDVIIAPNAFVNTDIPSHSIVIGNPAVIHPKDNATYGYISNPVK